MASITYRDPLPAELPAKYLAVRLDGQQHRFVFFDHVEIGRYYSSRPELPGQLLIDDPTISRRHCFVTQTHEGRCWVRDVSRNGTRLDGRRLVPNIEHEIHVGQALELGQDLRFRLEGDAEGVGAAVDEPATVGSPGTTVATVLVGDIRDYTVLVRRAPSEALQCSVGRVFQSLTHEVIALGGAVKEYQGDALFAFWDRADDSRQVIAACRAALHLDEHVCRIAADRSIWDVPGFELGMDWALATGMVVIDSFGGDHPAGLSMVGESVVRAFRLEKFANDETGRILTCEATRLVASQSFNFRDLGKMQAKGFDKADRVYSLTAAADAVTEATDDDPGLDTMTDVEGWSL
jgi:class 3 adenylate cyclase